MKTILVILSLTFISGCSTLSGAVKGFGDDVKSGTDKVADWVKPSKETKK